MQRKSRLDAAWPTSGCTQRSATQRSQRVTHFRNRRPHLVGFDGLESDAPATVRRNLDDLRLTRTVLARIAKLPSAQAMQLSNRLLRYPQFRVSLVDQSKRVA